MAKVKSFGERIADALVEDGLLSAGQIEELLEQRFASATVESWVVALQQAGIGAHALKTVEQIMDDPWARAHNLSITRDHPGLGPIDSIGVPPRLSRTPAAPGCPAPQYGADTAAILAEHGLAGEQARLLAAGAVRLSL